MNDVSDISHRLAEQAEAVCRAYLPSGRRTGRYWLVGDVEGHPGKSLFVRLFGDGAGKWTDAATGEHGDLLDLIRLNKGLSNFRDMMDEARHFLRDPAHLRSPFKTIPAVERDTPAAALKLHAISKSVPGTLAETYLRGRAITANLHWPSLRFYPNCFFRPDDTAPLERWPALLGVVTDLSGTITGLQRTYLARDGTGKAPFAEPRRALGHLLGNAVRFREADDVLAAGEGIETVLSLLSLFPALPAAAGLSAAHLAALHFPAGLRRLYVLRENDAGGDFAEARLAERCLEARVEFRLILSAAKDLNDDLRAEAPDLVRQRVFAQLHPDDSVRFQP